METIIKNTVDIKKDLHKFINFIDDFNLLKAIYLLLSTNVKIVKKNDLELDLPHDLLIEIEEAVAEADRGEFISHEEAMKQIKAKIQSL